MDKKSIAKKTKNKFDDDKTDFKKQSEIDKKQKNKPIPSVKTNKDPQDYLKSFLIFNLLDKNHTVTGAEFNHCMSNLGNEIKDIKISQSYTHNELADISKKLDNLDKKCQSDILKLADQNNLLNEGIKEKEYQIKKLLDIMDNQQERIDLIENHSQKIIESVSILNNRSEDINENLDNIMGLEHLHDVDIIWSKTQEQQKKTNDMEVKYDNIIEDLKKKIKVGYWLLGGVGVLAIIELFIMLTKF